MDDFPYKQISLYDAQQKVNNLKHYQFQFSEGDYKIFNIPQIKYPNNCYFTAKTPLVVIIKQEYYDTLDNISDRYNEKARMLARRYDQQYSPHQYWQINKNKLKDKFYNKKHDMREAIYATNMEATTFRPSTLVGLVKFLQIKQPRILDPCAGWGDRLIGACALNAFYVGVDPNSHTQQGYQQIISELGNASLQSIIASPFEDALLPNTRFNLVFTSPPYFDLEVYDNSPQQSTSKFSTLESWYNDFLLVMINKALAYLDVYGKLCININNIKNQPDYVNRMVRDINKRSDVIYDGIISYNLKSPQPIFIWTKIPPINYTPALNIQIETEYTLVQEGSLYGGAKQRVIPSLQLTKPVVYAGPDSGFAQVAIGLAAKYYQQQAVFVTYVSDVMTNATVRALQFGTQIDNQRRKLNELQIYAKNTYSNFTLLEFGIANFTDAYAQAISKYTTNLHPTNVWVTSGSGTILRALAQVFPRATIHAIQVGKPIYEDIRPPNCVVHVCKLPFNTATTVLPPYKSVATYDAKLWEIFLQEKAKYPGTNVIFNIAAEQILYFQAPQLNIEYSRWSAIHALFDIAEYKNLKNKYEAHNCLERYLLTMCNLSVNANIKDDPILDLRAKPGQTEEWVYDKFIAELREKLLPVGWGEKAIAKLFTAFPTYNVSYAITDDNVIKCANFSKKLSASRINLLRQFGSDLDIVITCLRYDSILARAQHWNMPKHVFEAYVNYEHIDIEGFASPLNTQLMWVTQHVRSNLPKYNFCSLFYDTDCKYGSLGSFFEQNFANKVVTVGPPYTEQLFEDIANFVQEQCMNSQRIKFIITMAYWPDSQGQLQLKASKFLTYFGVLEDQHYYINSNDDDKPIAVKFKTVMFVLTVGYTKKDYTYLFDLQRQSGESEIIMPKFNMFSDLVSALQDLVQSIHQVDTSAKLLTN